MPRVQRINYQYFDEPFSKNPVTEAAKIRASLSTVSPANPEPLLLAINRAETFVVLARIHALQFVGEAKEKKAAGDRLTAEEFRWLKSYEGYGPHGEEAEAALQATVLLREARDHYWRNSASADRALTAAICVGITDFLASCEQVAGLNVLACQQPNLAIGVFIDHGWFPPDDRDYPLYDKSRVLIENVLMAHQGSSTEDRSNKLLELVEDLHREANGSAKHSSDDPLLSAADLAERFGVNSEALRKRLDRWRLTNHAGFEEVSNPGPREPRFIYRLSAVTPIVEGMRRKQARQASA